MNTNVNTNVNVIVIWQSLVVSAYRSFWIHFARTLQGRVTAVVPHEFWELGGQMVACAPFSDEWKSRIQTHVLRVRAPHIQMVWFHGLARVFRLTRRNQTTSAPNDASAATVLVALMEPYSLSALFVYALARIFLPARTQILFYSLQNIYKEFPLPLRLIQNFLFKRSPNILALSEEVTGVLRKQGYRGHMIRFPLWADSSLFRPLASSEFSAAQGASQCVRIAFCGAVTASKGIPDLLAAIEMLSPQELSNLHFEMAGGGPLLEETRARMAPLQALGLQCTIHGPMPAQALPELFNRTDILIVPSRTEAHWKEQFGRVIVEAWACGATVIGSNSGEIPVLLGEPALIFEERNPHALASTLRAIVVSEHSPAVRAQNIKKAEPFLDVNLAQRFAQELVAPGVG